MSTASPAADPATHQEPAFRWREDVYCELAQATGGDESVVAAARVSTDTEDVRRLMATDPGQHKGLINFLMKNRHGTPFEHNSMTFYVEAPIFVFREWHRHRVGWSYNEESGRYKQLEPTFYVPGPERPLIQVGKPGHYEYVAGTPDDTANTQYILKDAYCVAYEAYQDLLDGGIAREVARACLPVATFSSMWATCNARSLMAFLSLRTKHPESMFPSYPQREIEMCAEQLETAFAERFPITYDAFVQNGRVAP